VLPAEISAPDAVILVGRNGPGCVLDVRTGVELREAYIAGALHVPLAELSRRVEEIAAMPSPRLVLCHAGVRAVRACATLRALGIEQLTVVAGGILAYRAAGGATLAVSDGGFSLERQVRMAAGSLVLLSVGLGALVHVGFFALAGFVGAGLVFAGMTNWCGMAMLLAAMPWNRGTPPACSRRDGDPG